MTVPPYNESVARCSDCGHPDPVHARGCAVTVNSIRFSKTQRESCGESPARVHAPCWDMQAERWRCWTCNELLIVCTDEELSYGLVDIDPAALIAYLSNK